MEQVQNCTQSTNGETHPTEALMVVVSVFMGLLACVLLIRSLFRRLSGATTSHSTVSFFLWVVFTLFLPLTSYMFSEAKSHHDVFRSEVILLWMLLGELLRKKLDGVRTINPSPLQGVNKQSAWDAGDQIVRIAWIGYLIYSHVSYESFLMFVILWSFCIMKIAQRVAAVEVAKRSFALGENSHLVAGYMCQLFAAEGEETAATKTGGEDQNVMTELFPAEGEETAATKTGGGEGQNVMTELFPAEGEETAATKTGGGEDQNVMTECKYVIVGESEVKRKAGPQGYSLELSDAKMVTVGRVWRLAESNKAKFAPFAPFVPPSAAEDQGCLSSFALYKRLRSRFKKYPLKDLCLSFALYKLLRRRFEEYPSAEANSPESRQFLLHGLLGDNNGDEDKVDKDDKDKGEGDEDKVDKDDKDKGEGDKDKGERVFRVIGEELNFLRDYYYSTIPLMLSNIWFFLLNCVFMPVIPLFCCIVILKTTNVFHRLLLNPKTVKAFIIYDLIISLLLIVTLFLLEFAEVVVYMFSNWVMVCLLCNYAKKPSWQECARVRWVLTSLWSVKTILKRPKLKFNQHSILEPHCRTLRIFSQFMLRHRYLFLSPVLLKLEMCRRFLGVQSISVPKEVKAAIVKYLIDSEGHGPVPPIGQSVLGRNGDVGEMLQWACESDSAAETIIVWHIATCLYEENPRPSSPSRQQPNDHDTQAKQKIAEILANRKIAETLSKYCMYLVVLAPELLPDDVAGTETAYKDAVKEIKNAIKKEHDHKADAFEREMSIRNANGTAAEKGMKLLDQLLEMRDEGLVWKVLAEMWTEIVVYIAPSDNVKSHAQALARGEFITHIWALLSHGGILRWTDEPPPPPPPPADHDQSPV